MTNQRRRKQHQRESQDMLPTVYHDQQPPEGWEQDHARLPEDRLAPTSAVFAALIYGIGLGNARDAGWCV